MTTMGGMPFVVLFGAMLAFWRMMHSNELMVVSFGILIAEQGYCPTSAPRTGEFFIQPSASAPRFAASRGSSCTICLGPIGLIHQPPTNKARREAVQSENHLGNKKEMLHLGRAFDKANVKIWNWRRRLPAGRSINGHALLD